VAVRVDEAQPWPTLHGVMRPHRGHPPPKLSCATASLCPYLSSNELVPPPGRADDQRLLRRLSRAPALLQNRLSFRP